VRDGRGVPLPQNGEIAQRGIPRLSEQSPTDNADENDTSQFPNKSQLQSPFFKAYGQHFN